MNERAVGAAYSQTGAAWQHGPGVIYGRLADALVAECPDPVDGRLALDLGAGTGAATRALHQRGARVVAVDAAYGMLAAWPARPPSVVGDAAALPLRDDSVDLVVAAFSLNHLVDPVAGLREAVRVTRAGGLVLASAYAEDDAHPAKQAVEDAAAAAGWKVPAWYTAMQSDAVPKLATAERARAAAFAAGCTVVAASHRRIAFLDLGPQALVDWRLGMAQLAPFVATLTAEAQHAIGERAVASLQGAPPLVRSMVVLVARVP
jgi:SAM-dependent methyltransferase